MCGQVHQSACMWRMAPAVLIFHFNWCAFVMGVVSSVVTRVGKFLFICVCLCMRACACVCVCGVFEMRGFLHSECCRPQACGVERYFSSSFGWSSGALFKLQRDILKWNKIAHCNWQLFAISVYLLYKKKLQYLSKVCWSNSGTYTSLTRNSCISSHPDFQKPSLHVIGTVSYRTTIARLILSFDLFVQNEFYIRIYWSNACQRNYIFKNDHQLIRDCFNEPILGVLKFILAYIFTFCWGPMALS